jgi:hypothetical protein
VFARIVCVVYPVLGPYSALVSNQSGSHTYKDPAGSEPWTNLRGLGFIYILLAILNPLAV